MSSRGKYKSALGYLAVKKKFDKHVVKFGMNFIVDKHFCGSFHSRYLNTRSFILISTNRFLCYFHKIFLFLHAKQNNTRSVRMMLELRRTSAAVEDVWIKINVEGIMNFHKISLSK